MAAELATALLDHDKSKRSSDIPLFYGTQGKDTVTPQQLIDRIDKACTISNWGLATGNGDAAVEAGRQRGLTRKCDELYLCLRGKAIAWYHTLENIPDFDAGNWPDLTREFLDAYSPKYTARSLCVTLQELRQKADENVQDYYNRVSEAFRNAYREKPAALREYTGDAADMGTATVVQSNHANLLGVQKMQLHMMNTIFLGGLREELRSRVLEEEREIRTVQEAVKRARALELIISEKKTKGTFISNIEETEKPTEAPVNHEPTQEFEEKFRNALSNLRMDNANDILAIEKRDLRNKLNQNRGYRGSSGQRFSGGNRRYPQRGPRRSNQANGTYDDNGIYVCWHCRIPGHMQSACPKLSQGDRQNPRNMVVHTIASNPGEPISEPEYPDDEEDSLDSLKYYLN